MQLSGNHRKFALNIYPIIIICLTILFSACGPSVNDVEKITDQDELFKIAISDTSNSKLYFAAFNKLTDQKALMRLAMHSRYFAQRSRAAERVTDQNRLIEIMKYRPENEVYPYMSVKLRRIVVHKITDQKALIEIAKNDPDKHVRWSAFEKITDQKALIEIARNNSDVITRKVAVGKINDQKVLIEIARNDSDVITRKVAVEKIYDQKILIEIAKNDLNSNVRSCAVGRLKITEIDDQELLFLIVRNEVSYW